MNDLVPAAPLVSEPPRAHHPARIGGRGISVRTASMKVWPILTFGAGLAASGVLVTGAHAQPAAPRVLTAQEVADYDAAPYVAPKEGLRALVGLHFVLGTLDGTPVKVDTFCSDVCPAYTTRVVYLEPPAGKTCAEAGGVETEVSIPVSIARQMQTFCLPKVIVDARRKADEARRLTPVP